MPIVSWFCLGLLIDKNLVNVFTLTYPLQFIYALLKSIFATGANISKEKDQDENAVLSGMTAGIIVGGIIFGLVAVNVKKYIEFMNMDFSIYKEFTVYSILQLYIQLIFSYVLEKLYFEGKEQKANKYCIQLNLLNFIVLIETSIFIKTKVIVVTLTLISITIYVLVITIKQYRKFRFELHIIKYIKYESVEIANNILFFLIFLFGLSNALEFGEKYTVALNFVALITDTQWDSFGAITTVAKIDISKGEFNYKNHRTNAYKLLIILLVTTFSMLLISYRFYELDLGITLIYLSFELINFFIYPIYGLKTCYLQLTNLVKQITTNKITAGIIRFFVSLLKTPYCTGIGQVTSSLYQFITVNLIFHKNFVIDKEGRVVENK
jgi:hypothetical protein